MMEKLFTVPLRLNGVEARDMYVRGAECVKEANRITTDTYFGCLDCHAYAQHTNIRTVKACLAGSGQIKLIHVDLKGKKTVIGEGESVSASLKQHRDGYLYIEYNGDGKDLPVEIWYEGEGTAKPVKLSVIICTYKREETVLENLRLLSETVQDDPLLRESVEIICVDNGRTIRKVPVGVRLIPNPNYGGSGGYARGMIEVKYSTHLWLMDDDIAFEPTILRRVVTFLKYRKRETVRLAAGMFSFEQPTIQQEATACFDGYTFHSNASGLDFTETASLLGNRIPEGCKHLYGGWWSMVMPNTGELPMPFFIKLDDVEYGLRGQDYAIMNGFGVWHEAFGNKGNAWTEYYTTRNTLIIQSMYPELGHSAFKTMSVRLLKALAYGEPKCMEAALKGVEDYLAGVKAFSAIEPAEKHREIMKAYGARLAGNMTRGKMLKAAARNLIKCRDSIIDYLKALLLFYRAKRRDRAWAKMTSKDFWVRYLKLTD